MQGRGNLVLPFGRLMSDGIVHENDNNVDAPLIDMCHFKCSHTFLMGQIFLVVGPA